MAATFVTSVQEIAGGLLAPNQLTNGSFGIGVSATVTGISLPVRYGKLPRELRDRLNEFTSSDVGYGAGLLLKPGSTSGQLAYDTTVHDVSPEQFQSHIPKNEPRFIVYKSAPPVNATDLIITGSPDENVLKQYLHQLSKIAKQIDVDKVWLPSDIHDITTKYLYSFNQTGEAPSGVSVSLTVGPSSVNIFGNVTGNDPFQFFDPQFKASYNAICRRNFTIAVNYIPDPEMFESRQILQDMDTSKIRERLTDLPGYLLYRYDGPGKVPDDKGIVILVGRSSDPDTQSSYESNLPRLSEHVKIPKTWTVPDINQITGENLAAQLGVKGTVDTPMEYSGPQMTITYPPLMISPNIQTKYNQSLRKPITKNSADIWNYNGHDLLPEKTLTDFDIPELQGALPLNEPRYITSRYLLPDGSDTCLLTFYNPPGSEKTKVDWYRTEGPLFTGKLNIPKVWQILSPKQLSDEDLKTQGVSPKEGFKPLPPTVNLPPRGSLPENLRPMITNYLQNPPSNGGGIIFKYDPVSGDLQVAQTLPDGMPENIQKELSDTEPSLLLWTPKDLFTGKLAPTQLTHIPGTDDYLADPYEKWHSSLEEALPFVPSQEIASPMLLRYPKPKPPSLPQPGKLPKQLEEIIGPFEHGDNPEGGGHIYRYDPFTGELVPAKMLPNGDPKSLQSIIPPNQPCITVWKPYDPVTGKPGPLQITYITGNADPSSLDPYQQWYDALQKRLPLAPARQLPSPSDIKYPAPPSLPPDGTLPPTLSKIIPAFQDDHSPNGGGYILKYDPSTGELKPATTLPDGDPKTLQGKLSPDEPAIIVWKPYDPITGQPGPSQMTFISGPGTDPGKLDVYQHWYESLKKALPTMPSKILPTIQDIKYPLSPVLPPPGTLPTALQDILPNFQQQQLPHGGGYIMKYDPSTGEIKPSVTLPDGSPQTLQSNLSPSDPAIVVWRPYDPSTGDVGPPQISYITGNNPAKLNGYNEWYNSLKQALPALPAQQLPLPTEIKFPVPPVLPPPGTLPDNLANVVPTYTNQTLPNGGGVVLKYDSSTGKLIPASTLPSGDPQTLQNNIKTDEPSIVLWQPQDPLTKEVGPPQMVFITGTNPAKLKVYENWYNSLKNALPKLPSSSLSLPSDLKYPVPAVLPPPGTLPPNLADIIPTFHQQPSSNGGGYILKYDPSTGQLIPAKTLPDGNPQTLQSLLDPNDPSIVVWKPFDPATGEVGPTQLILVSGNNPNKLPVYQQWYDSLKQALPAVPAKQLPGPSDIKFPVPPSLPQPGTLPPELANIINPFQEQAPPKGGGFVLKYDSSTGQLIPASTLPDGDPQTVQSKLTPDEPAIIVWKPYDPVTGQTGPTELIHIPGNIPSKLASYEQWHQALQLALPNIISKEAKSPSDITFPVPPKLPPPGTLPPNLADVLTAFQQQDSPQGGGYVLKYDPSTGDLVHAATFSNGCPQSNRDKLAPATDPAIVLWKPYDQVTGHVESLALTFIKGTNETSYQPNHDWYLSMQQAFPNVHGKEIAKSSDLKFPVPPELPYGGNLPQYLLDILTPVESAPSAPPGDGIILTYNRTNGRLVSKKMLSSGDPQIARNEVQGTEPCFVIWRPYDPVNEEVAPLQLSYVSGTNEIFSHPCDEWYPHIQQGLPGTPSEKIVTPSELKFPEGVKPTHVPSHVAGKVTAFLNESGGGDKSDALILTVDEKGQLQSYKTLQDVPPGELNTFLPEGQPSFVIYRPDDPSTGEDKPPKLFFVPNARSDKEIQPYLDWLPLIKEQWNLPYEQADSPSDVEKYMPWTPPPIQQAITDTVSKIITDSGNGGAVFLTLDPVFGNLLSKLEYPTTAKLDELVDPSEPVFAIYRAVDEFSQALDPQLLFITNGKEGEDVERHQQWYPILQNTWVMPSQKLNSASDFKPTPSTPKTLSGDFIKEVTQFLHETPNGFGNAIIYTVEAGKLKNYATQMFINPGSLGDFLPPELPCLAIYKAKDDASGHVFPPQLVYITRGNPPEALKGLDLWFPLIQSQWNVPSQKISDPSQFKLPVPDAPSSLPDELRKRIQDFMDESHTDSDCAIIFTLDPDANELTISEVVPSVTPNSLQTFIQSDKPSILIYKPQLVSGLRGPIEQLVFITLGLAPEKLQLHTQWFSLLQSAWKFSSQNISSPSEFKLPPYVEVDPLGCVDAKYKMASALTTSWTLIMRVNQPSNQLICEKTLVDIPAGALPVCIPPNEPRLIVFRPANELPNLVFWDIGANGSVYETLFPLLQQRWGIPSIVIPSLEAWSTVQFSNQLVQPIATTGVPQVQANLLHPDASQAYSNFCNRELAVGASALVLLFDIATHRFVVDKDLQGLMADELIKYLPLNEPRVALYRSNDPNLGEPGPTKIIFSAMGNDVPLLAQYTEWMIQLQLMWHLFWSIQISSPSDMPMLIGFLNLFIDAPDTVTVVPTVAPKFKAFRESKCNTYALVMKYDKTNRTLDVEYPLRNNSIEQIKAMMVSSDKPIIILFREVDSAGEDSISILYIRIENAHKRLLRIYDGCVDVLKKDFGDCDVIVFHTIKEMSTDFYRGHRRRKEKHEGKGHEERKHSGGGGGWLSGWGKGKEEQHGDGGGGWFGKGRGRGKGHGGLFG